MLRKRIGFIIQWSMDRNHRIQKNNSEIGARLHIRKFVNYFSILPCHFKNDIIYFKVIILSLCAHIV